MHRWLFFMIAVVTLLSVALLAEKQPHQWLTGKIVDESRARYLGMVTHNRQDSTTTSGTWNGTANSTTIGETTNTTMSGGYSGRSNTSSSGYDMPLYKVYDNLIIEGSDMVYVTQERLRWRWSKGAQVTVNGEVKYYVDGRKLHLLDDSGKEHAIQIVKQILKRKENLSPTSETNTPPTQ
jgi:hypothetical protein